MKILLTNDDGFNAKGIQTLANTLKTKHDIYICAPDKQKSSSSHSATYFLKDLTVKKYYLDAIKEAYSVSGTPADCIYVAINALIKDKIDLVISGINQGWNVSKDCFYSGTVSAAREALFLKIPAIACSLASYDKEEFTNAAKEIEKIIPLYMEDTRNKEYILNVNVPLVDNIKGYKVVGFEDTWDYINNLKITTIETDTYNISVTSDENHGNNLTNKIVGDASACYNGYVALTALSLNMVSEKHCQTLSQELQKFFENSCL